jgi:PD-(D/E)XK nuclease superfamily protein
MDSHPSLQPLAPMLREIDGTVTLCVDGSALSEIMRCPRAAYYKLLCRRVSSREDRALIFGKVFAKAMEWRYTNCGSVAVGEHQERLDALIDQWWAEEEPVELDSADPFDDPLATGIEENGKRSYLHAGRCKDVVRAYNQHYGEENFRVLGAETGFSYKLGGVLVEQGNGIMPVHWEGRPDLNLIVEDADGEFVVDFKTTGKFGGGDDSDPWRRWRNSSSMFGYCHQRWRSSGRVPFGFVIRCIVVRPPLKSNSSRSTLPRDSFEECSFPVTEARLLEWERNTLYAIQQWVRYAKENYWPMHDCAGYQCSFCPYLRVCRHAPDEAMMTMELDSSAFKVNTWTALRKEPV